MQPANRTHFIVQFSFFSITSQCETPRKRIYNEYIHIYIYGSEEVRFRNVRVEGNEGNDVERKRFTLLPLRSREEALTLNFGGVDFRIDLARGPGSIDRFRMAGSFGRDPPRRNSCRGSSDSGGPRRAE